MCLCMHTMCVFFNEKKNKTILGSLLCKTKFHSNTVSVVIKLAAVFGQQLLKHRCSAKGQFLRDVSQDDVMRCSACTELSFCSALKLGLAKSPLGCQQHHLSNNWSPVRIVLQVREMESWIFAYTTSISVLLLPTSRLSFD